MKHTNSWSDKPWYDPRPETLKAKAELDKILQHAKFNHRTKALWAYFRGNKSADKARKSGNKVRDLILLNLVMNGALGQRLMIPEKCRHCAVPDCEDRYSNRQRYNHLKRSIKRSTVAHWNHAVALIDIAKLPRAKHDDKPARPKGY